MRRALLAVTALLLLVACEPPAFQPQPEPLPGVTLEVQHEEARTVVTVEAEPALQRLFLRLPGADLSVAEDGCEVVGEAVECLLRDVTRAGVTVTGAVSLPDRAPVGVACRDECAALHVAREGP